MVDFIEAFKKPFSDLKTAVIAMVLSIIPIVNFIYYGWILKVAESGMRKQGLPEFKEWGKLFINGLLALVIMLIYTIPLFVLIAIYAGIGLTGIQDLSLDKFTGIQNLALDKISTPMTVFGTLFGGLGLVYMGLLVIVGFFSLYFGTVAFLRFAETKKFGASFDIGFLAKKAFTSVYFLTWLIGVVTALLISAVLGWIPILNIVVSYFVGVFLYTVLGEAYSEV